uniref:Receptor activity-modifying protein 1 n=1 Tax=Oryctolagus cuniculus TaxID=9986 RepID=G1TCA5_RABIT
MYKVTRVQGHTETHICTRSQSHKVTQSHTDTHVQGQSHRTSHTRSHTYIHTGPHTVTAYRHTHKVTATQDITSTPPRPRLRDRALPSLAGSKTPAPRGQVLQSYGALTHCTQQVAAQLGCFWPNAEVDKFFVAVHQHYFRSCPVSGRAVHDPPSSVLCPFIVVPIVVTLLVTALVVWRSKRTEGIV